MKVDENDISINKEKAERMLHSAGLQLPLKNTSFNSNNIQNVKAFNPEPLEILRSIPEHKENSSLLPEVADWLNVSVSYLENKPIDFQDMLIKTYIAYGKDANHIQNAVNYLANKDSNSKELNENAKPIERDYTLSREKLHEAAERVKEQPYNQEQHKHEIEL